METYEVRFDHPWEHKVVEESLWWSEYGCPLSDPRAVLPEREYRAHLAILLGRTEKRKREREKSERAANQAHAGT